MNKNIINMRYDNRPNLSNQRFEQYTGDTLTLYGTNNFYGISGINSTHGYRISGVTFLNAGAQLNSILIGGGTQANSFSIAIGADVDAMGMRSVSIGDYSCACGIESISIGYDSRAFCNCGIVIGVENFSCASGGVIIGGCKNIIYSGNTNATMIGFQNCCCLEGSTYSNSVVVPNLVIKDITGSGGCYLCVDGAGKIYKTLGGGGGITGVTNGLTCIATNRACLGGTLTSSVALSGNYCVSTCGGATFNTTTGYRISGTTILKASTKTLTSIYLGCNSGTNGTGLNNIGIGCGNLTSVSTGSDNLAFGCGNLASVSTGCGNLAFGCGNLASVTIGCGNNIAIGTKVLTGVTSGHDNIGIGRNVMRNLITGANNVAIGCGAMLNASGATAGNVAIGGCTLCAINYTIIGTAANNTAIGTSAVQKLTTGSCNVGVGYWAACQVTTGCHNVSVGFNGLNVLTIGNNNIAIGRQAGYAVVTGSSNIFIGYLAGGLETTSCKLYIDNSLTGIATARPLIYGDFSAKCAIIYGAFKTSGATSLLVAPVVGTCTDSILVWNSSDCLIKKVPYVSGATNGLGTISGKICLGGNLTNDTNIGLGAYTLKFTGGTNNNGFCINSGDTTSCHANGVDSETRISNNVNSIQIRACKTGTNCLSFSDISNVSINLTTCDGASTCGSIGTTMGTACIAGTNCITITSPVVKLVTTPSNGACCDSVLVWDAGDGIIKKVPYVSGSTGSGITGATNGLCVVGSNPHQVCLGGVLTNDVEIRGDSNSYDFWLRDMAKFCLQFGGISNCQGIIEDTSSLANKQGLEYAGDYSATFADNSLITKKYVRSQVSGITGGGIGWSNLSNGSTVAGCGTCISGTTLCQETLFGVYAGKNLTSTACGNVGIGYCSIPAMTDGCRNIGIGLCPLYSSIHGADNIGLGFDVMFYMTGGSCNIGLGQQTLFCNLCGCNNTAIGNFAMYKNCSGYYNIAIGDNALQCNTIGNHNIAIGNYAMNLNLIGDENIGIGRSALAGFGGSTFDACYNVAIGSLALWMNYCQHNTAVGWSAIKCNSTGSYNTALGSCALFAISTGANNVAIGHRALASNTGSGSVGIGYQAGYNETGSNKLHIGNSSNCSLIYGEFDNKRLVVSGTTEIVNNSGINYLYLGEKDTDNSWRMYVSGSTNLVFERRISGTWTCKGSFAG
jgi:hypothetical protein